MMSSGVLSQEEIDALLRGGSDPVDSPGDLIDPMADLGSFESQVDFSDMDKDVIGEIANITMGTAATTLSTLLGKKVDITTPTVSLINKEELQRQYPAPFVVVDVHYTVGLQGTNVLIIRERDAATICDLMMGGDGTIPPGELSELHLSAVSEAMNQMMGSASTSLSTMLKQKIDISPPSLNLINFAEDDLKEPQDEVLVKIAFRMVIEGLIDSELMQLYPVPFAKEMVGFLMGGSMEPEPPPPPPPVSQPMAPPMPPPMPSDPMAPDPISQAPPQQPMYPPQMDPSQAYSQQPPPPPGYPPPGYPPPPPGYPPPPPGYPPQMDPSQMYQQQMMYQQPPPMYQQPPMGMAPNIPVQPVQFAPLQAAAPVNDTNLNLIMDVPLQISVELGKAKKSIREVLELGPGSVIELDKLAGEPVDLLVNGKLLAKGEVVVIDENFGVRITDIVNPMERLSNLQ